MTKLQEQAIDMIKRLPDDKIAYVIGILKSIDGLSIQNEAKELSVSQNAYRNLQKFRKKGLGYEACKTVALPEEMLEVVKSQS